MKPAGSIFFDIDGVLLKHQGDITQQHLIKPEVLPGVLQLFQDIDRKGFNIILVTGRRESVREYTEKQLAEVGIFYDHLIMGLDGGPRTIINDRKPNNEEDTCFSINVTRNSGLVNIKI